MIPQASLEKPPSAELRPDQKDIDSLPPYEVLDTILEEYVEDSHTAEQIAADHGYDLALVQKVIRMVDRAEYKRQQAAPGLKISPKAFGSGRRFPIAAKTSVMMTASTALQESGFSKGTHASFACSAARSLCLLVSLAVAQQKSSPKSKDRASADPQLQHPASFGRNGQRFHEADVRLRSVGVVEGRRRSGPPKPQGIAEVLVVLSNPQGTAEQPPLCHRRRQARPDRRHHSFRRASL